MFVDRREALAFLLSAVTVVLFILAIIVFIKYRANAYFYTVVALAFASGFVNAWIISKMEPRSGPAAPMPPARRARRRPSGRRRRRR